jgi:hypothetical protein
MESNRERSLPTWWQAALLSLVRWGVAVGGGVLASRVADGGSPLDWAIRLVGIGAMVLGLYYLAEAVAMRLGIVWPKLPVAAWAGVIVAVVVVLTVIVLALDSLPPAAKLALLFAGLVTAETVAIMTTVRRPNRVDRLETEAPGS